MALAAWLGLVFLWCGVALCIWCFHTLGRYVTPYGAHELKAVGPLRLVSDVRRTAVAATPTRGVPSLWEGSPCDDGRGGRRSRSWPPR